MTGFVIATQPRPSLPVLDVSERFPVRRIYCVGRNYAAHAREMGADPTRETPFFFTKPGDAVVETDADIPYPPLTQDLHHEVELVIAIGSAGQDLTLENALERIWGWAVGVDLTRRDMQNEAKAKGRPWDASKGFDYSAPIGPITPRARLALPHGDIRLTVEGQVRQHGQLSDMIWNPAEIVAQASHLWRLEPGDLIFTGTPEGVGPIQPGERVEARIEGLAPLDFTIV
jgi:fumarylpyruvate hydrolase